jgi:hypothetical protein
MDSAVDQIERFAGYLRNRDVGQMVDDVERFARRQPGLFLGSAFTIGLLAARFLKSSSPSTSGSGNYPLATRGTYGSQNYGQNYGNYGGSTSYGRGYTAPAWHRTMAREQVQHRAMVRIPWAVQAAQAAALAARSAVRAV